MVARAEPAAVELGYPDAECQTFLPAHPYQRQILDSDARIIVTQWGRATGKSHTLYLRCLRDCVEYPRLRVLVVAPEYRILQDALWPIIEDIDVTFRNCYGYSFIRHWRKSAQLNRLELWNGSSLRFRSTTNVNALRGGSYGEVLIEEAGYVQADPSSWAAFLPVIRGWGPHRLLVGGTPQGMDGVLGLLIALAAHDPSVYLTRAGTQDNPFYPKVQLEMMRSTLSREMWEQEGEGKAIRRTGRVYAEFDPDVHVGLPQGQDWIPEQRLREPGWETYVAIDWGYNQAHAAFLAVRQPHPGRNPEIWIYRDLPFDRMDADTICRRIVQLWKDDPILPRAIVVDPKGWQENRTAIRYFGQFGRPVIMERAANKTLVEHTLEYVRRVLRSGDGTVSLHLTRAVAALPCNREGGRGMLQGFLHYMLQETVRGSGIYKNKPIDDNKTVHGLDLLRYWLINMGKFGYEWPYEPTAVPQAKSAGYQGPVA
jgi:hypothetical protein